VVRLKRDVNVSDWIDQRKVNRFQAIVIILCGLVVLLDGFDTLAISFVAPVISKEWNVPMANFGPVFSAGLFGLMLGALILGPVADRVGRKKVIVLSAIIFGLFSLLTPFSSSLTELILFRFLTGLGLGGSMPNTIALTSEYSPRRIRTTLVTLMFIGFPLGSAVGGFISSKIISSLGWHSVFYLGGIIPIVLALILIVALPESIRFLVAKGTETNKVIAILNRIDRTAKFDSNHTFYLPEKKVEGFTVKHLFGEHRTKNTILLWIVFFTNLLVMYFVLNWLPSVLKAAGFSIEMSILSSEMMQFGGVVGGLIVSRLGDKGNPRKILPWFYVLAAISVALIGSIGSIPLLMCDVFLVGFTVTGSQFIINGLAASIYSTSVRSTGVGWALGIGRIGSIIGPIIGGVILSLKWGTSALFLIASLPALVAAVAISFIVINRNHEEVSTNLEKADLHI
jgi:AAHS family 4-hydroxybenzoate transporter-like MFS transporter